MKPAHTIVDVPLHIDRVPTYVRRKLADAGPKVRIGCAYQPRMIVAPAFYVPKEKPKRKRRYLIIALAVVAVYFLGSGVFA